MESAVVLKEHPWITSEIVQPNVTLPTEVSARGRKKLWAIAEFLYSHIY